METLTKFSYVMKEQTYFFNSTISQLKNSV